MRKHIFLFTFFITIASFGQSLEQDVASFFSAYNQGDYSTALKFEDRLIEAYKPFKDTNYIDLLTYIGKANQINGKKERAKQLATENYILAKQVTTPKNPRYYRAINALAYMYILDADYRTARKYYQEAWDSFQSYPGTPVLDQIQTKSNLAYTYLMTGDFALSAKNYEQNLKTIASNFGEQNERFASDLYLLADAQNKLGEIQNAINSYETAKEIYYKLYGKFNSQSTFCSINQASSLANVNNKQSRLQSLKYFIEFEEYHKNTGDTISEIYLTNEISHGLCLNSLSSDFLREDKVDSAQHYSEKSKYIFNNIVNTYKLIKIDNPKNLAVSFSNLGSIADVQKNYTNAVRYYQLTIDILEKNKTSKNTSEIIYYQSRLGNSLIKSGQKSKGEKILNNIKASLSQIMEDDPLGAFGVLQNLGTLCQENNDIEGQIQIENISLSHGRKVYKGEQNEQVLLSHSMLANHYYTLKNADSICFHFEKAKDISRQIFGYNSPNYIDYLSREIIYLSSIQLNEQQSKHLENLFEEFESISKQNNIDQGLINEVLVSKQNFYYASNNLLKALSLQQSQSKYENNQDTLTTILLRTAEIENLKAIGKYFDAYEIGHELFLKYPHMPKDHLMKLLRVMATIPYLMDNNVQETYNLLKWSLELHKDENWWKNDPRILRLYIDQDIIFCKILLKVGKVDEAIIESNRCMDLIIKNFGESDPAIFEVYYNLGLFYMLKDQPAEALQFLAKAKTSDQYKILADCNISLGNYKDADKQYLSYYDQIFKLFREDINKLSEKDFPARKFSLVTQFLELLNYTAFRAEQNPELLEYVIEKWFYLNDLGLRKGRLYNDLAQKAGLEKEYFELRKSISDALQLPPDLRLSKGIIMDDLILEQRKLEMLIGEKTELFEFDNSIESIRNQLDENENYVFVIPFSFLDLTKASSANIAKKDGNYAFFVGSITKDNPKIEFTILKNAFELKQEAYQRYLSYVSDPQKKPTDDFESYSYFIKPIEKFFQYKKTYFCGADVYLDINIESIYHPIEKKSVLETYNISFVDALTSKLQNNTSIRLDEVALFGDVSFGDGTVKANKINDYNSSNSIVGISTMASSNKNSLIIYKVESNFPAEKAGLVLGDEILEINGERIDLRENAETFYLSKIRGKVGTVVNLKLKRNVTNEIFEVSLKRELPYVASPIVNWNYLKGTKIEIQEISKIIQPKSKKITIYSGENASEENLKKIENPSVLHIATHSFYIDREKNSNNIFAGVLTQDYKYSVFLLNGLVMSGVNDLYFPEMSLNKENGFLNGLELSLLNIKNTDLVVISGCESGQGVHGIGEGISGLKEALFRAGAKNLILAKYPISDRATQDFFTEFYSRLSSGGSIDEVLRATKIEMNKKYKHPYYWSAFQLHIR